MGFVSKFWVALGQKNWREQEQLSGS